MRPAKEKLSKSILREFAEIDWSFPHSAPDPVHATHPYPAKFIPEIPSAALGLVKAEGLIVDPFSGIGTTLIESIRRGRTAVGTDLNPIATVAAQAKLSGWRESDARQLQQHRAAICTAVLAGDPAVLARAKQDIPRIDHWFDPLAQEALSGALGYLTKVPAADPWHIRLAAALSSIVVRVSRQESDTRYAAIDKDLSKSSIANALGKAIDRVARSAFLVANQSRDGAFATAVTADASSLTDFLPTDEPIAAAIFSPPYPNAYEYWLYHKYRMYWLGFDPVAVRGSEIGARPFYSGSGTKTEDDFEREMARVLLGISGRLASDGIVLIVVGDSKIRGRHVDNSIVLTSAAASAGLRLIGSETRTIRATRRSFNLSVARAKTEHVLLFGHER